MAHASHVAEGLPADKLRPHWPADRIPWKDSSAIPRGGRRKPAQPRALAALELACRIRTPGYNVYLSGEPDLGRTYLACDFLEPLAEKQAAPPDLIYVSDFSDEDHPVLLQLPAGQGRQLRRLLGTALKNLRSSVETKAGSERYLRRKASDLEAFGSERAAVLSEMETAAGAKGYALETDEQGGLSLMPVKNGRRMSDDEILHLDSSERHALKARGEALLNSMSPLVHRLARIEKESRRREKECEKELVEEAFRRHVMPVAEKIGRLSGCSGDQDPLAAWFASMKDDVVENSDLFFPRGAEAGNSKGDVPAAEDGMRRYEVNLFVDNGSLKGAPVVVEDHPTFTNLLGCIERESEMGSLVTDFTLLRAGSLHKANGGYLVLHAADLFRDLQAWEGLVRALRSGLARIEDPEACDSVRVRSIDPVPVPLNVKVVLIGDEDTYEDLLEDDERFSKLFKIKAELSSETGLGAQNVRSWLVQTARIADEADLPVFDAGALARIVDFGSELCEDRRRISLRFPLVREIMVESAAFASIRGSDMVGSVDVAEALRARRGRSDMLEKLYMEEYDRDLIKIRTSGLEVGRVNGLAVIDSGGYEFGLPHRISCSVGVGNGGIIDLEREAELGGPIHTKAMMILKSFLLAQFAWNKPLVLSGSLYFEQSYTGIEGDSASGAELAALLSAISGIPLKQSLAFTGAVSQTGRILAVGGVTRKIEGFFGLCERRGLAGDQGVIIPADNVDHLMLDDKVVEAVRNGSFSVHPVSHIAEALELLTGVPAGRRLSRGSFTHGSLFEAVDDRLVELGRLSENSFKGGRRKKKAASGATGRKHEALPR